MLTRNILFLSSFWLLSLLCMGQSIPSKPNPPRLVNDFAAALSNDEVSQLEKKLRVYNDTTSTQLTVVIVPTIGDYDMNTFATELGRAWGVGQKDKNNGLILLWSTGERKVYIATGYGLEGALPDAYAKRIINNDIVPAFKEGRFYDGLNNGIDSIIQYLKGEYKSEEVANGEDSVAAPFLILFIIFLIITFLNRKNKGKGGGLSGGMPYTTYTNWGPSSGSWGGGSSSGGSSFGGFGGGSFGGGGAGGDY